MKKIPFVTLAGGVAALFASSLASGAGAGLGPKASIFAEYDLNKNGVIDGDEVAAVRKAFTAEPKGRFVAYDTNNDGKLDDNEIAGIKPPGAKKDGEKNSGGKKKADKADKP